MSRLRPFYAGFWFGGFNGITWMVGLGTPMVLLAQQLGASTFQVGLATSFVFLLLPVQVLATATLHWLGYKRQMVFGWGVRALFLLPPLGLAIAAPATPEPWMANVLVASVFGFCFFRAFGVAAHIPWMAEILPLDLRGRFFATDSSVTSLVGVATLLLCAALFATLPPYESFVIVYALALTGSALAIFNLKRLPSAPNPDTPPFRTLPQQARRLCLEAGPFRAYLVLALIGSVVTSALAPFTVYFLKTEVALSQSRILLFTASQFAGAIVGTWVIRTFIDGTPIRRFFQAASLLIAAVDLFWLAFVVGAEGLAALLPAAYFTFGIAFGVNNAAHFTYLPELAGEEDRAVTIAVFTAVMGVLSGLAPMLWGLVLEDAGPAPGMNVGRFAGFFALGLVSSLLLCVLFERIRDARPEARVPGAAS